MKKKTHDPKTCTDGLCLDCYETAYEARHRNDPPPKPLTDLPGPLTERQAVVLYGTTLRISDDIAENDLEIRCERCEEILGTVEHRDNLETLVGLAFDHYRQKHAG